MSKRERMSATATLTNCYTPLPVTASKSKKHPLLPKVRYSGDGTTRSNQTLRRLCLSTSILPNSTGSSLVELGHTKVLCAVHGPRPVTSSSLPSSGSGGGGRGGNEFQGGGGVLHTEVRFAPKFGIRPTTTVYSSPSTIDGTPLVGNSSTHTEEEVELSSQLLNALLPSVNLSTLVKCVIDVYVVILQADGNALGASITAASLALADSGVVEMYDLVCACSVAVIPNDDNNKNDDDDKMEEGMKILADPTEEETLYAMSSSSSSNTESGGGGGGVVTLAFMPNWKEVTLWNQIGCMDTISADDAVSVCRNGCNTMYQFMRNCLVK